MTFRADVSRVDLAPARENYGDSRRRESGRGEVDRAGFSEDADLDALFKIEML